MALNVWQPQVVHGRQKQLVQQCTVSVDSRVSDLNMELKVCKQQIATYKNVYVCDLQCYQICGRLTRLALLC